MYQGSCGAFQPSGSSGRAFQPAESTADASQLGGLPTVRVRLGCFNCGIDQAMLSKDVHVKNLSRVIAKAVGEQDLHMVTLCEVGSHKQGLEKSHKQEPQVGSHKQEPAKHTQSVKRPDRRPGPESRWPFLLNRVFFSLHYTNVIPAKKPGDGIWNSKRQ